MGAVSPSYAEEKPGDALQLARETELLRGASNEAASLGKLPEGSIVNALGERRGGFVKISVELEDGEILEGWVEEGVFEKAPLAVKPSTIPRENQPRNAREKIRVNVPDDEALLLRRDPSFFYGVQAGGNFGITSAQNLTDFYTGLGFSGGGHAGIYLGRNTQLRFEVNFSQITGQAASDLKTLSFNFLEIGVAPVFKLSPLFEVFAGLQYGICIGIGEVPTGSNIVLASTNDLSALNIFGGAGARFVMNPNIDLLINGRYNLSFLTSPFAFQNISLMAYLEVHG